MIGIVDYGMGNLRSVQKACEFLGYETALVDKPEDLRAISHLIVPGVGAFADAMAALTKGGMDRAVIDWAASGQPLLGICLGMQLFFQGSEEGGWHPGLGLFPGQIRRFSADIGQKVPQIGWNSVHKRACRLFAGLPDGFHVYFVHSFRADASDADFVAGATCYGETFTCAVERGNVMATQFHPEKSGTVGLRILRNFLSLGGEGAC